MSMYKCPVCESGLILHGIKHLKHCDQCGEIVDVDKLRVKHTLNHVSVLNRILGNHPEHIHTMLVNDILAKILV